jgi:nicotinate-nucleotide adenylyltransferase
VTLLLFFMSDKRRILFGGTFDPVHLGHTKVASAAVEYIGAERLIFIPAKRSPLKGAQPRASDIDRLKMLSLAVSQEEKFEVSDYELNKPAPSYTLDTVRHFQSLYSDRHSLFWLIGADSINDLIYWYGITDLIDECNLATMYRAGFDKPDFSKYEAIWGKERFEKLQRNIIPTPLINISSTKIRKEIASGNDVSQVLDNAVLNYIIEHRLYGYKPDMPGL